VKTIPILKGVAMDGGEAVTPSSLSMTMEAQEAVGSVPGIENVEIESTKGMYIIAPMNIGFDW
jgi:hypothetical protein